MPTLRSWLAREPFELVLTSGFFGFFAHAGMLRTLLDEGIVPRAAAGSSAGALVSAAWAAGVPMRSLAETLRALRREDFWDPAPGLGLLRGRSFRQQLERLLPVRRFEECAAPLSVSTYDVARRRTHVIREGELAPAVVASCAVPFLFQPVRHEGRWLLDGGLADRPGLLAAGAGRKLVHHLASRSPWRASLEVPRAAGACTLVIESLPRSGPSRLEAGVRAMELARVATARALDRAIDDAVVRVHA